MSDNTQTTNPPVNSLNGKPAPSIGDVSQAIADAVRAAERLEEIKTKFAKLLAPYEQAAKKAESRVAAMMKDAGLKALDASINITEGETPLLFRAEFMPKQAPKVEDWDTFYAWIRTNNRFDMLHKRVSSAPVVELFQMKEPLPDGISVTEWDELKISTTKAKKPRRAA